MPTCVLVDNAARRLARSERQGTELSRFFHFPQRGLNWPHRFRLTDSLRAPALIRNAVHSQHLLDNKATERDFFFFYFICFVYRRAGSIHPTSYCIIQKTDCIHCLSSCLYHGHIGHTKALCERVRSLHMYEAPNMLEGVSADNGVIMFPANSVCSA